MKFQDIYIYGEVLFDCFENGDNKLGGAPFNVAWNLKGFGLEPKIITSIGDDELGKEVLNQMKNWGLDTNYINIIPSKKTGMVKLKLDNQGIPTYKIEEDAAYDYIDIPNEINKNSIVYHGSLSLRNDYNQKECDRLKTLLGRNSFVDINLRNPWWNSQKIYKILSDSKWLKINDEEMPLVCKSLGFDIPNEQESLEFLLNSLNLELIILTKGSQGALLFDNKKNIIELPVVNVDNMVDTVGAGDAFASVVIYGIFNNWEDNIILKRAMEFASTICSFNGAIIHNKEIYNGFTLRWKN